MKLQSRTRLVLVAAILAPSLVHAQGGVPRTDPDVAMCHRNGDSYEVVLVKQSQVHARLDKGDSLAVNGQCGTSAAASSAKPGADRSVNCETQVHPSCAKAEEQ